MSANASNLVWIDLEMTGLDCTHDAILEIATIITDSQLQIVAEGPSLAIYQAEEVLKNMGEWCQTQHSKSGLIDRVRNSSYDYATAQSETLTFLKRYAVTGESPMCGNSVCQDRRFLARLMPDVENFFHYRHVDVSTLKELAKRWYPGSEQTKDTQHRALSDIHDSINELIYYRTHIMKD